MRDLQDSELVALATSGEHSAFGELARRYAPNVRALLRRMGAQPMVVDDIAQDAFLVAFERIDSFRGEGSFGAWLNRIAARLYVKRWRSDSRLQYLDEPQLETLLVGDDSSGSVVDLDKALLSLTAAERLCVSLCHGAGWSHSEIAVQLRLPIGTVKSHVKRGLDKLRARLCDGISRQTGVT